MYTPISLCPPSKYYPHTTLQNRLSPCTMINPSSVYAFRQASSAQPMLSMLPSRAGWLITDTVHESWGVPGGVSEGVSGNSQGTLRGLYGNSLETARNQNGSFGAVLYETKLSTAGGKREREREPQRERLRERGTTLQSHDRPEVRRAPGSWRPSQAPAAPYPSCQAGERTVALLSEKNTKNPE